MTERIKELHDLIAKEKGNVVAAQREINVLQQKIGFIRDEALKKQGRIEVYQEELVSLGINVAAPYESESE